MEATRYYNLVEPLAERHHHVSSMGDTRHESKIVIVATSPGGFVIHWFVA